jgi:hypothetical protein
MGKREVWKCERRLGAAFFVEEWSFSKLIHSQSMKAFPQTGTPGNFH